MKACVYSRVSTDNQETEGTSLQTQLEACLNYCQGKGYDVSYRFSETYSGLSLERPKLNELRELVRAGDIDVLVVYCLDRLSRDPTHGVILTQEFEKHNVTLEAVTEDIDTSELGKLISYIRGFAAKLETEKIKERTHRGKIARLKAGRLMGGACSNLYGYRYQVGSGVGEGTRYIDTKESKVVRQIYDWFLSGDTLNKIVVKLLGTPSPLGNPVWNRITVFKMLKNKAYTGVAEFCGIEVKHDAIIPLDVFEKAQVKLHRNKELSKRNSKEQYLLSGFVFCGNCGRRYVGSKTHYGDKGVRYYNCTASSKRVSIDPCPSRGLRADTIEPAVWREVESALLNPALIFKALEGIDRKEYAVEMEMIEARLSHMDKEKDRCWKAYLVTGDELKFKTEIGQITLTITGLEKRYKELEAYQKSVEAMPSLDDIEVACEIIRGNLGNLTFEEKRLCLEALKIKIRAGNTIRLEGVLPIELTRTG